MNKLMTEYELMIRIKKELQARFNSPFVPKVELIKMLDEMLIGKRNEIKERKNYEKNKMY